MTAPPDPRTVAAIEALLFASSDPLSADALRDLLSSAEEVPVALDRVDTALEALRARYAGEGAGIQLVEIGGGWEFRTRAELADYVRQLFKQPPVRLTRAALEVLSVVAYRQPCTRADVEDIRGVDCSRVLRALLERGLIRIIGKADDIGRPLLYGTSPQFLEFFGLNSLGELPTLREYTELTEEHVVRLQEFDATLAATRAAHGEAPEATTAAAAAESDPTDAPAPTTPAPEHQGEDDV